MFVLNLLAYCPVQGAFGAYTFWGPKVKGPSYFQLAFPFPIIDRMTCKNLYVGMLDRMSCGL